MAEVSGKGTGTGGIVGYARKISIIDSYNNASINSTNSYVGGLIGLAEEAVLIENSYNTNSVSGNYRGTAGIIGYHGSVGDVVIRNTYNLSDVTGSSEGIAGILGFDVGSKIEIDNCYNEGKIIGNNSVGGLVGYNQNTNAVCEITNSYNKGDIEGQSYVSGILAHIKKSYKINKCYNTGSISCSYTGNAGGIVGWQESSDTEYMNEISNCYNGGEISATGADCIGGILGRGNTNINNCYNTGCISTTKSYIYIGGIAGYLTSNSATISVSNCYNLGEIEGGRYCYVGGIIGINSTSNTNMSSCYSIGLLGSGDTDNYLGGIIGSSGTIACENCYYLAEIARKGVSNQNDIEGSLEAVDTIEEIKAKINLDLVPAKGWNYGTNSVNNGYPTLSN